MRSIKQKTRDDKYYWKGHSKGYEKGFADVFAMMKDLSSLVNKDKK